jgi:hypothetical protein
VRCWVSYVYVYCFGAAMHGLMDGWTHSSLCWGPCFSAWSSSMCTATEKRFQKAGSRTPAIVVVVVVRVIIVIVVCERLVNLLSYCGLICGPACRRDVGAKTLQRSMSSKCVGCM